jgi:hypothetical protein
VIRRNSGRHRAMPSGNSYSRNTASLLVSACIPARGGAGRPVGPSPHPGPGATRVARGAGGIVMVPPPGVSITVGSAGFPSSCALPSRRGASGAVSVPGSRAVDSVVRPVSGCVPPALPESPQPAVTSPISITPTNGRVRVTSAVMPLLFGA